MLADQHDRCGKIHLLIILCAASWPVVAVGQGMPQTGPENIVIQLIEPTESANTEVVVTTALTDDAPSSFRAEELSFTLKEKTREQISFTAPMFVDLQSLKDSLIGDEDSPRGQTAPVFRGRQLVEAAQVREFQPQDIQPGLELRLTDFRGNPNNIDPARELMITHPSVVKDPARTFDPCTKTGNPHGVWTFGHIMSVLADTARTGITADAFVKRWLSHWEHVQVINNFTVEARPQIRPLLIDPWIAASGGADKPLKMQFAPFRLLAIVNRIDLRDNTLFNIPPAAILFGMRAQPLDRRPVVLRDSNSGEARLVFGAVNVNENCDDGLPFTVIFEFGINTSGCLAQKAWARQWHGLRSFALGDPRYNRALQAITDQFIQPALRAGEAKRRHALNQLRTNEIALGSVWELREFRVAQQDSDRGHIRQVTVKQTPNNATTGAEDLNNSAIVSNFVNANEPLLLENKHTVPLLDTSGAPFVGARSLTLTPSFFWNGAAMPPISNNDARHHFSLNTCNGCHGGETATPAFVMVSPTEFVSGEAKLAPFLTGTGQFNDPVVASTQREFNDLLRRREDLDALLRFPCFILQFRPPLTMTH